MILLIYDIIIWDFNGTIINDVDLCYEILNKMLKSHNLKTISKSQYKNIFRFPVIDYYRDVGFNVENNNYDNLSNEFIELYQNSSLNCKLYPNIKKALKYFKENHYLQICLSASQIDNLKQQLKHFKIDKYFDVILGLDNTHAHSKIDIGKNFLESNNLVDKKILCIGDSTHDYEVSMALNADCYLMSYGHINKKRLKKVTDKVFSNINEMLNYFKIKSNQ